MPDKRKRLELRLPANHPVWTLPEGSRNRIVCEWIDIGAQLHDLRAELERLDRKLDLLLELNNKKAIEKTNIDKNKFLSYFK